VSLWLSAALFTVLVFWAFGITGLVTTRRWPPSLHDATVSYNDIVEYFFGAITLSDLSVLSKQIIELICNGSRREGF